MAESPSTMTLDYDMFSILRDNVDPIKVAVELQSEIFLEKDMFYQWQDFSSKKRIWKRIIEYVTAYLTPQEFLSVLFKSGYNCVALQLSRKLCKQLVGPRTTEVDDSCNEIFYALKTKAYNKTLERPQIDALLESFQRFGEYKRNMRDANKLAYVLCAGLDTIIMSFTESLPDHPWFKKLKTVNLSTTNTNLFNVAYQSRLAIASAVRGEIEDSNNYLSAALMESLGISDSSIITNMYYFAAYIKGCEFERNPTSAIKDEILKFIDLGLQTLVTQKVEVQEFWRKMFLQRKIYCYLGLSNKACPISKFEKDRDDLEEASKLLAEIYPIREGMDDRRKQLFLVADARYHELQEHKHTELALTYLNHAISLDPEMKFGDTRYIKQYKSELQDFMMICDEIKPSHEKQTQSLKERHVDLRLTIKYIDLHPDICKVLKSNCDVDYRELINTVRIVGFDLYIGNRDDQDLKTHFKEDFYLTFLRHQDLIMPDVGVKELRRRLLKFLKQNPLHEMNEHFGDFVKRSCHCHLSHGSEFMTNLEEKMCWQVILQMVEKETFCGAVEVWGIARLCNIPLSVLSFRQDRTSVQKVSFNFCRESLTNDVLYVGHVFHETHKFFPLRKVSADTVHHLYINPLQEENKTEIELLFDMVSRKLPQGTLLFMFCDELGIEYTESKITERSRDSESYFLAMFKWYTKYPNIDHNSKLRDILSNLQRQDIIESLTDFKKISFQEFQIHNPELLITDKDICFVCEHLVHDFRHLVRYLGLPQNELSSIEVNNSSDVRKTIYKCLRKVNEDYSLTRIYLCNGIEYASQNRSLIKELNERWKKA